MRQWQGIYLACSQLTRESCWWLWLCYIFLYYCLIAITLATNPRGMYAHRPGPGAGNDDFPIHSKPEQRWNPSSDLSTKQHTNHWFSYAESWVLDYRALKYLGRINNYDHSTSSINEISEGRRNRSWKDGWIGLGRAGVRNWQEHFPIIPRAH